MRLNAPFKDKLQQEHKNQYPKQGRQVTQPLLNHFFIGSGNPFVEGRLDKIQEEKGDKFAKQDKKRGRVPSELSP